MFRQFILILITLLFSYSVCSTVVLPDSNEPLEIAQFVKDNREKFISALKVKKITGIELLIGDGTSKRIQSLFGHASIRLLDDDDDHLNDIVISFQMLILNDSETLSKALGGWENLPHVSNLRDAIFDYMRLDMRGLKRLVIPASDENIEKMVMFIASALIVPDVVGDYHFIFNNCLDAVLKVLAASGFPVLKYGPIAIPSQAESVLKLSGITYFPSLYSEPRVYELFKEANKLFDDRSFIKKFFSNKTEYLNDKRFHLWLDKLSSSDIEILHNFWPKEWIAGSNLISARYAKITEFHSIEELIDFKSYPASFYKLCTLDNRSCREDRISDVFKSWSIDEVLSNTRSNRYTRRFNQERERAKELSTQEIFRSLDPEHPFYSDMLKLDQELKDYISNSNI
jgi:hypothetical protein